MPSKKRKYNARFPAGRIKKIMQTDEEVGKVAQAVPIIISRTLELFVEALLKKSLQVTNSRNAKTLSPSHVKQCIFAETRFDFLRDLVKNVPDVSVAEERDQMSAETSPNSSRFPDAPPRRIVREDSSSSSSGEVLRVSSAPSSICSSREHLKREIETPNKIKIDPTTPGTSVITDPLSPRTSIIIDPEPSTSIKVPSIVDPQMSPILAKIKHKIMSSQTKIECNDTAIDLSKKEVRTANFYHETLVDEPHKSVIKVNPTYASQPSTSYTNLNSLEPVRKASVPSIPSRDWPNFYQPTPDTPRTPVTPVINIDFSNMTRPVIKVLDETATPATVTPLPKNERIKVSRQNSRSRIEVKKVEPKPAIPVDIDILNSGNPQIDEDYDT